MDVMKTQTVALAVVSQRFVGLRKALRGNGALLVTLPAEEDIYIIANVIAELRRLRPCIKRRQMLLTLCLE